MGILALDLGSKMGFSVCQNGQIFSGTKEFKNGRFEGGGMRYLKFQNWLDDLKDVNAVYFEEVRRHLGTDASHAYGGYLAILSSWCERKGIPYGGIPVQTIKKHITGKGNASKQMVILAVQGLGFRPQDDNEADSLALLDYVINNRVS